jgi:protein tyrosine phosphatase
MVWEQRAPGIVMLNQLHELYQGEMYWPGDDVGAKVRHGSFDVTLKSIGKEKVYTRREFELRNVESNASRSIVHLHLTKWPDYGVPRSPDEFVLFWAEVRKLGILDSKDGPGIIHCTGGVGRSGTFCFVDVILRKFKKTGSVKVSDLPDTLLQLRKQRCWLIQTPEQLRLAYLAILSGVEIVMSGK